MNEKLPDGLMLVSNICSSNTSLYNLTHLKCMLAHYVAYCWNNLILNFVSSHADFYDTLLLSYK